MAQNREPPAYQEYAATVMAKVQYRTMTLEQRGLLYTMKLECWINESLPSAPEKLAKVLGFSTDEIERCLPAVKHFFQEKEGLIWSQELEDYRNHLREIREKQAAGGRKGAAVVNQRKSGVMSGISSTNLKVNPRVLSTDQINQDKYNQTQSLDEGVVSFVSDYENNELTPF